MITFDNPVVRSKRLRVPRGMCDGAAPTQPLPHCLAGSLLGKLCAIMVKFVVTRAHERPPGDSVHIVGAVWVAFPLVKV
jgi:hypothetical protein